MDEMETLIAAVETAIQVEQNNIEYHTNQIEYHKNYHAKAASTSSEKKAQLVKELALLKDLLKVEMPA